MCTKNASRQVTKVSIAANSHRTRNGITHCQDGVLFTFFLETGSLQNREDTIVPSLV